MAVGLILAFPGRSRADYDAVNAKLDIDTSASSSDWPPGLLSHVSGTREDGSLIVMEVWESRDAQTRFMQERLGPALHAAGIDSRPEVTWIDIITNTVPSGSHS